MQGMVEVVANMPFLVQQDTYNKQIGNLYLSQAGWSVSAAV
jgi:hypothetical protein